MLGFGVASATRCRSVAAGGGDIGGASFSRGRMPKRSGGPTCYARAAPRVRGCRAVSVATTNLAAFPVARQQRVQLVPPGTAGDDALEHIGQPGQRIGVTQLCGPDQRGDGCAVPVGTRNDSRSGRFQSG